MAQLSTRRLYAANEPLLKSDLDAFIDDIETFINVTNLNDDNFQTSGITASSKILDGSLTSEKLENLAITTAKITDANITTAKIADLAVTTAKIADANVTTAKIAASAVTTDKIASLAVTGAKLESALKTVTSESFSANIQRSLSYTTIEATSLTVQGQPVLIMYNGYFGFSFDGALTRNDQTCYQTADIVICRVPIGGSSETQVATLQLKWSNAYPAFAVAQACNDQMLIPGSTIKKIDTPTAGLWTYYIKARFYSVGYDSGFVFSEPDGSFDPRFRFYSGFGLSIKELV